MAFSHEVEGPVGMAASLNRGGNSFGNGRHWEPSRQCTKSLATSRSATSRGRPTRRACRHMRRHYGPFRIVQIACIAQAFAPTCASSFQLRDTEPLPWRFRRPLRNPLSTFLDAAQHRIWNRFCDDPLYGAYQIAIERNILNVTVDFYLRVRRPKRRHD